MKDKRTLTYTIENTTASMLGEWLDIHQFPRKTMKDLFGAKAVRLDGQLCTAKSGLSEGMVLEIIPLKERIDHDPIEIPLTITYEDEDILFKNIVQGILNIAFPDSDEDFVNEDSTDEDDSSSEFNTIMKSLDCIRKK